MLHRFFLLLTAATSLSLASEAARIQPRQALDRVLSSETAGMLSTHAGTDARRSDYTLAYSAPSGAYHVFSRSQGGYIVVSGDDEIYPLLADVTSGTFSPDEMAPQAEALLNMYDAQIQSFTTQSDVAANSLVDNYSKWTEIQPLMTTKWNQSTPYNALCPAINGQICMTGCTATAMAQVVKHIGYYKGNGYRFYNGVNSLGQKVEFDYSAHDFDFTGMADSYSASDNKDDIDQIASLMLACGLSVSMNYGVDESGAYLYNVATALVDNFGYDADRTHSYKHKNFTQSQWEEVIYRELELGRPVCYAGYNSVSGHAFVIDGYRPAGTFHVNWGWGGTSDGYFRLTALSPSQIGIGGNIGGYNLAQELVCAVPPGAESGIELCSMQGSLAMVSDGVYSVYFRSSGQNNFDIDLGAVVTDRHNNRVASAVFWPGQNITASGSIHSDSYQFDFTQLALSPGEYRIYPAFQPKGSDMIIAEQVKGRQHYIILTVDENGRYTFTNMSENLFTSDIYVTGISPDHDLHVGFSGTIRFHVVNNGGTDYYEVIRIIMSDSEGNEKCRFSSSKTTVPAAGNVSVYATTPAFDSDDELLAAGTYYLRFETPGGKTISEGLIPIEIKTGNPFSAWKNDTDIEVTNYGTMPAYVVSGEEWPHTPFIYTQKSQRNMMLRLAFYNPGSSAASHTLTAYEGNIDPMNNLFPLSPLSVNVPFGTYNVCYRKSYSQISQMCPIKVGQVADNLAYFPFEGDKVSVRSVESRSTTGVVEIPASVTINGAKRTVTAIDTEGFMSTSISVLDMPASLTSIGFNALTYTPMLRQLIMRSENPPFTHLNHPAPGLSDETEFYVPADAYSAYESRIDRRQHPLYTIVESIESKDASISDSVAKINLQISPAHQAVNPQFIIVPDDETAAETAGLTVAGVKDGQLTLNVRAHANGTAMFRIYPAHHSNDYAVVRLNISNLSAIGDIEADSDKSVKAIYDTMGRPVGNTENISATDTYIIVYTDGTSTKRIGADLRSDR